MALAQRLGGVLLHPTSLPGPHGSGDLGPAAFHFVDWLVAAAQNVWQVLPLTPVGYGSSPYAGVSAFAGSPQLVALEPLVERGWLATIGADELRDTNLSHIDFARVEPWRLQKLRAAFAGFSQRASSADRTALAAFCGEHKSWLGDYALFMALDVHYRKSETWIWSKWEPALARRERSALAKARKSFAVEIGFWQFVQWCFFTQWRAVKDYANHKGVQVVGDLPIFVAHHSADCWARPDLFLLDPAFEPSVVAGVPPDFFSPTGQRWGNPLYDWKAMQKEGFAWWIARVRHELARADLVRIDHFRGFAGYWEIPATCETAIEGRWVAAPGQALFATLQKTFGELPVIAEDLGVITPDVEALRDDFGLPGMTILQFGFGGDANHKFLPHNHTPNSCVYTGTHDNDTVVGWWHGATERERGYAAAYLQCNAANAHWQMIRAAWASVARLAVCQMQDALGLGSEARMNTPARLDCWTWRFTWDQVGEQPAARLAQLSAAYGRAPIDRLHLADYPADARLP